MSGSGLASVLLLTIAASTLQGPQSEFVLRIDGVPADEYLVGKVDLTARVEPEQAAVAWVDFVVEGMTKCHLIAKPFRCVFDLPARPTGWKIVVTAVLRGGRTLTESFTTVGITEYAQTRAVVVPIIVTDQQRRPIKGLSVDAFHIFDEGTLRKLDFCQSQEVELDIVLAVDVSASMKGFLSELHDTLQQFLAGLHGRAHVTLLGFNQRLHVLTQAQSDNVVLSRSLYDFRVGGSTALYDAIFHGLDYLGADIGKVRTLIVFTDGDDQVSRATPSGLREKLRSIEGSIYVIVRETRQTTDTMLGTLDDLASASGGRMMLMENIRDLQQYFDEIRNELADIYLCGFTPTDPPDGRFHSLRVEVPGQSGAIVRARNGYVDRDR